MPIIFFDIVGSEVLLFDILFGFGAFVG